MKDIARDLGVSVMTVSKALRGHNDISEATRQRVLQRARQLGYQPNWVARSLVSRRTYMVGLVIPDLMHSFFAEVAKGAAAVLEPAGYHIVILNSEEDPQTEERQIGALLARSVDGLLLASAQRIGGARLFRMLEERKLPYVLMDRLPAGARAHYVGCEDERIGEMATEHLIRQGCRRIAHLRGPDIPTGIGRLRGYRRALARHGLPFATRYVVRAQHNDEAGYLAMQKLLRMRPLPDGVFGYNDPVAAGAIRAILEAGIRVPEDIAVIGSGNVHYSDLLRVPLSTIDQNSSEIGRRAAELLLELIENKRTPRPRRVVIAPRLIVRQSSRRIGEPEAVSATAPA
ncbi:MAG: LacI family DNA-binding transcriptional regulator [Bryobacterales bacterium]|nr:LacI family DNA-binding transcriptional regulator [Bryobacterales bacterium]